AQQQVDKSLMTMDQLKYTGNLTSTTFENYRKAVADLEKAGEDAKDRAEWMKTNREEFVSTWQREMEKIEDPQIKASVEARQKAVRDNAEQVRASAAEA